MRQTTVAPLWLLLSSILPVYAEFEQFFFGGINGDKRKCSDSGLECPPPAVCAFDRLTLKYYCCKPGSVCWSLTGGCGGGNDSTPSGSQKLCSSGGTDFCCLKSSEDCTESAGQINLCWSTLENPVLKLNATRVNETFNSLLSASPSASSYPISLSALQVMTSTTADPSASSSEPTASTATTQPAPAASSVSSDDDADSGLSGGAIGGIVGGVVGGLAVAGLAGFLFWRRRKSNRIHLYEPATSHIPLTYRPEEMEADQPYSRAQAREKDGHQVAEAPANQAPAELPTGQAYWA